MVHYVSMIAIVPTMRKWDLMFGGVGGGDDVEVDGEVGGAGDRGDDDPGDNILSGCQLIISASLVSS